MNCENRNTLSPFWRFFKKFPVLRYMKFPAFKVEELYERYYDGLESGAFAFVISEFIFYGWHFESKTWKRIGLSFDDLSDEGFIRDAPKDDLSYIRNNGEWIEGVEEAPKDGTAYHRIDGEWVSGG